MITINVRLMFLVLLGLGVFVVVQQLPDIQRYLRLRSM